MDILGDILGEGVQEVVIADAPVEGKALVILDSLELQKPPARPCCQVGDLHESSTVTSTLYAVLTGLPSLPSSSPPSPNSVLFSTPPSHEPQRSPHAQP